MKKIFLSIVLIIASVYSFSQSKDLTGTWLGSLDVGVKLRLAFNISKDSARHYRATMESPDQGVKGIVVSLVTLDADSLHIRVNIIKGSFDGLIINDTTVAGKWRQGPFEGALAIIKTDQIVALNRPQAPKPPFNYLVEDVEYSNSDNSVHFGGTFTYPSSGGRFPTAILITGSGQQDRDETILEHKPFAVIADYLTKKGFAILRVDDRGVGRTTGEVMKATSADFAIDVEAGLSFLKTRTQTDTTRLGLIGHSEGGLIAALVASKRTDIDFMILLGAPGVNGQALLADQSMAVLRSKGISSRSIGLYKPFYSQLLRIATIEEDTSIALKKTWNAFEKWKKQVSEADRSELGFTNDSTSKVIIYTLVKAVSLPWMRYFLNSDPQTLFEKTNAKVLAMNGEKDIQVLPAPNLKGISVALQKSKSKVYDIEELPGLNHLFQKCTTCTIEEYSQLEQTFSPDALMIMSDWLEKNVNHEL